MTQGLQRPSPTRFVNLAAESMQVSRAARRWLSIFVLACVTTMPAVAFAQSSDDPDGRVESMLNEATNAYDSLNLQKAESTLSEAIDYAESNNASAELHARAHVLMGVVTFAKTRDENAVREKFIEALEIDRNATVPDVYKQPKLTTLMSEARERADLAPPEEQDSDDTGATADKSAETEPPPETFQHTPVTTTDAGDPVELTVRVPASIEPEKIVVFARRYDQQEYWKVSMQAEEGASWHAKIDGSRVYTSQLDYYIEATDEEGTVLANSGSAASPHSITVLGAADYSPQAQTDDGTSPDADGPTGPSGPPDDEQTDRGRRYVYVQATGGTAGALIFGGEPTANPDRDVQPGLAPAFAHTRLDIGGMVTERTHVGMFFRWQFSPAQSFQGLDHLDRDGFFSSEAQCLGIGLTGDCQLGLMVRHFISDSPGLKLFASGGLGFGRVREWLRLKEPASEPFCDDRRTINSGGDSFCYRRDTMRPGWFHVGGGGGLQWPVTNQFSLVAEGYLQILAPTAAVHLDVNVGPRLEF